MNKTIEYRMRSRSNRKIIYNPYAKKRSRRAERELPRINGIRIPSLNTDHRKNYAVHSIREGSYSTLLSNRNPKIPLNLPSLKVNKGPKKKKQNLMACNESKKLITANNNKSSTLHCSCILDNRPSSWKDTGVTIDQKTKSSTYKPNKTEILTRHTIQYQMTCSNVSNKTTANFQNKPRTTAAKMYNGLPRELMYASEDVKPIQDEYRMSLIKNAKLSDPLKNGWMLFPHQKKAVVRSLTMRRMILALDMGLGKTLIGAVWSKAFKDTFGHNKLKVFVICPVSLKEEWKRTAENVGLKVHDINKKRQSNKIVSNDNEAIFDLSIYSWAKIPKQVESAIENFVVCCDEAHAMQSNHSQRTKDVLNLTLDQRCVGVLLLTGTPMKNGKPSNLFPLLNAVRHPLGRHQKAYEKHFCNGMVKNFGRGATWDATGCSNLDQLKKLVSSNLLHMTKDKCLMDLPPMTNIFHDVTVSSRFQHQYKNAVQYLANVRDRSKNLSDEAVLGAVQKLRVVCANAKIDATVELTRHLLDNEPAVVVFTSFSQVAKQVHSKLVESGWPCSLLTGETPSNKRQGLVDNFQNGLTSVFVCTFGAGGVGLTLIAASTIILLDRPWTPGETRQAEDRIRRIGQVKDCKSYWMRSFDLDKQIDDMLESKELITDAVLSRTRNRSTANRPSAKISISQLVYSFVVSKARKNL